MAAIITLPTAAAKAVSNPRLHGRKPRGVVCLSTARGRAQAKQVRLKEAAAVVDRFLEQTTTHSARYSLTVIDVTDLKPTDRSRVQFFVDGLRTQQGA